MAKSKKTSDKIIFAYNAKGGFINGFADSLHKVVSPSTYQCKLCELSHHSIGMRFRVKTLLESLPYKFVAVHSDELKKYPQINENDLPFVGLIESKKFKILLSRAELEKLSSTGDLVKTIKERISKR